MRVDVSKTAAVFLVIVAALSGYGDETAWFNAAFDDYAAGETLSDKGAAPIAVSTSFVNTSGWTSNPSKAALARATSGPKDSRTSCRSSR